MADFEPCFRKTLALEGGYLLHDIPGDRGGPTYAGIARNRWPMWKGWLLIDAGEFGPDLKAMVYDFFKREFWDRIQGDDMGAQVVACHIYSFAVNAGRRTSIKMAQRIIGATVDGFIGPKTLQALNGCIQDEKDEQIFTLRFSLDKIFRFKDICRGDRRRKKDRVVSNLKFLPGWINRVQRGLEWN